MLPILQDATSCRRCRCRGHIADVCAQVCLPFMRNFGRRLLHAPLLLGRHFSHFPSRRYVRPVLHSTQRHPGMFRRDEVSCLQEPRLALHVSFMYELEVGCWKSEEMCWYCTDLTGTPKTSDHVNVSLAPPSEPKKTRAPGHERGHGLMKPVCTTSLCTFCYNLLFLLNICSCLLDPLHSAH